MITVSKITEFFCIADNFRKEFEAEMAKEHFRPLLISPNEAESG